MKRFLKPIIILAAVSFGFVACKKSEDFNQLTKKADNDKATTSLTCEETTYMDPGICGGVWFKKKNGVYLEVFGMNEQGEPIALEPGQKFSFTYEPYDSTNDLVCQAMTEFEHELYEQGATIHQVSLLEICEK